MATEQTSTTPKKAALPKKASTVFDPEKDLINVELIERIRFTDGAYVFRLEQVALKRGEFALKVTAG